MRRRGKTQDEARGLVLYQVTSALEVLSDLKTAEDVRIHECRKKTKIIRAMLRMIRPALGDQYKFENRFFRDASRRLSLFRDQAALRETMRSLVESEGVNFSQEEIEALATRIAPSEAQNAASELLAFRVLMENSLGRISSWEIEGKGFDVFEKGLKQTYARGRRAMEIAYATPAAEHFHEWRKHVKYHRYQIEVLRKVWKPVLKAWNEEVVRLSDLLGEEHDLVVLQDALHVMAHEFPVAAELQAAAKGKRLALQGQARTLGRCIYAEKPEAFTRRMHEYWVLWRES